MARPDLQRPFDLILDLDTARGSPIGNSQCSETIPATTVAASERRYRSRYPGIETRTRQATATYNCHGMTFGSRRTQIFDSQEVRKILMEDSYRRLDECDVLPGDVAVYVDEKGDMCHSALIVEKPPPGGPPIPKVVSKWGPWVEVIHWVNQCPYVTEFGMTIEYYRIER